MSLSEYLDLIGNSSIFECIEEILYLHRNGSWSINFPERCQDIVDNIGTLTGDVYNAEQKFITVILEEGARRFVDIYKHINGWK